MENQASFKLSWKFLVGAIKEIRFQRVVSKTEEKHVIGGKDVVANGIKLPTIEGIGAIGLGIKKFGEREAYIEVADMVGNARVPI